MDKTKNKKGGKRESRKVIGGIKLPPIEPIKDDDVKTILDIDPDFFSLVEGRPIRPDTSINKYKQNVKDIALKRTVHGFLIDEIMRIDKEIETERRIYETAYKHFEECQYSFDKFLAYDNDKTIVIMKKSDTMAKDLGNQTEEHKQASFEMATLKSKLLYIDETLLILLSFENFLHRTAPILWQERENVNLDVKHSEIITLDGDMFQPINIDIVKERLNKLSPPRLYFQTPDQLIEIFSLIEKQNLNYLLVTEELRTTKNKFLKAKDTFKSIMNEELSQIKLKMTEVEEMITWNEMREVELKEVFFRILEEKMRYLISSETALHIFNYVEFAYEQLIAPNDVKLSTLDMMLALEREFDNVSLDITAFDLDTIKEIEQEIYESSKTEIKQAIEANRLLKDVEKLNKRLKSSFEPPKGSKYEIK